MSFLITRRPEKQYGANVKFSRWTALHNPYIFEFTREDYHANNTLIRPAYHATLPTVWLDGDPVTIPTFIEAGDRIYLNSGMYNGVYTVHSVSGQYVTLDTPYIGNGGNGRLNMVDRLQNFKAYINIYDRVTNDVIDTVYPKPDGTGLLLFDVSGALRSIVETQATINQSDINRPNKGISSGFKIGYGVTYRYVSGAVTTDVTVPEVVDSSFYYWISAAKQIDGDITEGMDGIGQNMKEYVPKDLSNTYAKFLTIFEKPTYFEGFPFTLSFLYDEDFESKYLQRHQQDLNINAGNVGSETDDELLVTGRYYANQMKVRTPNAGTKSFDVWLETGDAITNGGVVNGGLPEASMSNNAQSYP